MEVEMVKQVVSLPQKGVLLIGVLSWLKVFVILLILFLILWIGFRLIRRWMR
jgi:hypothetical protein